MQHSQEFSHADVPGSSRPDGMLPESVAQGAGGAAASSGGFHVIAPPSKSRADLLRIRETNEAKLEAARQSSYVTPPPTARHRDSENKHPA